MNVKSRVTILHTHPSQFGRRKDLVAGKSERPRIMRKKTGTANVSCCRIEATLIIELKARIHRFVNIPTTVWAASYGSSGLGSPTVEKR